MDWEDEIDPELLEMEQEAISIQKRLLEQKNQPEKQPLDVLFDHVRTYLKGLKFPYRVVGGRAINAWLNPEHKFLNREEKQLVKSTDWDIEILGSNEDALEIAKDLVSYLEKKMKTKFDKRFENIIVMPFLPGFYVYQIGVPDGMTKTEWVVDVHGQTEKEFKKGSLVLIDGIQYPNLKTLLEQVEQALFNDPGNKGTKRFQRKLLIEQALKDISIMNKPIFNQLCSQCNRGGKESLTGFNLDCETIREMCGV